MNPRRRDYAWVSETSLLSHNLNLPMLLEITGIHFLITGVYPRYTPISCKLQVYYMPGKLPKIAGKYVKNESHGDKLEQKVCLFGCPYVITFGHRDFKLSRSGKNKKALHRNNPRGASILSSRLLKRIVKLPSKGDKNRL